jgi:L-arabinose transport system substrate-binding protein
VSDVTADDVIHVTYDGTLANGIDSFAATVTANPDVTHWILWSCNDDGVLGAVRALESAGIPADRAIGVGLGAHLACDEWKKPDPTAFRGAIFLDSSAAGRMAVTLLHDLVVNGTPLPENSIYEGVLATSENAAEVVGCA